MFKAKATTVLNQSAEIKTNFLEAGVHTDIKLDRIETTLSPKGNRFFAFYFKDESNNFVSHTEWEPKQRENETDDSFNSKVDNIYNRVGQICSQFLDKDPKVGEELYTKNVEGTSFESFINSVMALMEGKHEETLVRLKVVYGDNGYTKLPNYHKFQFIERMDAEKSKIKELGIDKFKRPNAKPDVEDSNDNPFLGDPTAKSEDHPF